MLAFAAALLFTVSASAKNIHYRGISCVDKANAVTCSLPASTYPNAESWTVSRAWLMLHAPGVSVTLREPFDAEGIYQHLPLLHSPGAYAGIVCKTGLQPGFSGATPIRVGYVVCTPDDLNGRTVHVYLYATPDGKMPPANAVAPCGPTTPGGCATSDG